MGLIVGVGRAGRGFDEPKQRQCRCRATVGTTDVNSRGHYGTLAAVADFTPPCGSLVGSAVRTIKAEQVRNCPADRTSPGATPTPPGHARPNNA